MQWVYAADNCTAVWGTLRLWKDLDLEGGLTIEADSPAWRHVDGVDGEVMRVRRANFTGSAVLNISQHSATNRDLLARLVADALTGLVAAPFLLVDLHAGIGFSSPFAYLEGLPPHSYSGSTNAVPWRLKLPTLVPIPGVGLSTGAPTPVGAFSPI